MTVKLGSKARTILLSATTSTQGAKVYARGDTETLAELVAAGLIGPGDGLTMRGTIARERALDALLAEFAI